MITGNTSPHDSDSREPAPTPSAADVTPAVEPSLRVYPEHDGLPRDERYRLTVNGREVFVHHVIINPTPNGWGYRGPGAMAMFDFAGRVEVELTVDTPVTAARVRPASRGVSASVDGNVVRFTLERPGQFWVQLDGGRDYPFYLFANPIEADVPDADDPDVIFVGPGVHDRPVIEVKSDQTLYLAPGAFVNGTILVKDATNVRVRGRGILHGGHFFHENKAEHGQPQGHLDQPQRHPVIIQDSTNVVLEGITIIDNFRWAVRPQRASNLLIENVKIVGWRRNSDGINPCNTQNLVIRDCFIKNQDDGISIKGTDDAKTPTRNFVIERMTMLSNWMRSFVVGGETRGSVMERITFRDCDIVYSGYNPKSQHGRDAALGVWVVDDGLIQDILFENIRVEEAHRLIRVGVVENQHSAGRGRGNIRNVTYRDITVLEGDRPVCEINGHDETHDVRGVRIENVTIGGKSAETAEDLNLTTNEHVHDMTVTAPR